jgi:hypothetical protein
MNSSDLPASIAALWDPTPPPVVTAPEKVVLFADMLGFAALTEAYPVDIPRLTAYDGPMAAGLAYIGAPENRLAHAFSLFHFRVRSALTLARIQHPLTAISFSDSVFVATDHLFEATGMAIQLVQSLMRSKIPVRVGVAHGSFVALRFRSDVIPSTGEGDHASQFVGTGVVRAHAAEECGIKGIRILLHPSVIPLLNDPAHNPVTTRKGSSPLIRTQECSPAEIGKASRTGVQQEVDYWHQGVTDEGAAWKGLQEMWDAAPTTALEQYEATAEAINRMLNSQGRGLTNLRRRTLPRRK